LRPIWSDKAHTWKLECLKSSYLFMHFSFHCKMNACMDPTIFQTGLPGIFLAIALNDEWEESWDKEINSFRKGQCLSEQSV